MSRAALLQELATSAEYDRVRLLDDSVAWAAAQRRAGARPRNLEAPRGTDERQSGRLLRSRAAFAVDEMGAAAVIGPQAEIGGRGGGRGAAPAADFTTAARLDSPLPATVTATDDFLEFLFSGSEIKYEALKAKAQQQEDLSRFTLTGVTLTFNLDADYQVVNTRYTRNVIGIVEGADARLKDRHVAFGAHYDHLGYLQGDLPAGRTDRIYNGADDDGSGTAALIGLARTFARAPKTKRSLIFIWHAGEELVPRYLELLAAGGSREPEQLGEIVGIELADPGFWDAGLDLVERQLQEAEAAARASGRV